MPYAKGKCHGILEQISFEGNRGSKSMLAPKTLVVQVRACKHLQQASFFLFIDWSCFAFCRLECIKSGMCQEPRLCDSDHQISDLWTSARVDPLHEVPALWTQSPARQVSTIVTIVQLNGQFCLAESATNWGPAASISVLLWQGYCLQSWRCLLPTFGWEPGCLRERCSKMCHGLSRLQINMKKRA